MWNEGEVFERAEFLGDAFLQVAVSLELARRSAKSNEGDFTTLRAALVCNLHLGELLTRRFGVEMALGFFEGGETPSVLERKGGKGQAKLEAIRSYIQGVRLDEPRANMAEAVKLLQQADGEKVRVRAQVETAAGPYEDVEAQADAASPFHRRGEDYRKPVGDMYEAIVGLMLCALEGDVAATWGYFCADFFPSEAEAHEGDAEEGAAELQRALENERKHAAKETVSQLHVPGAEGGGGNPTGPPVTAASEPMQLDPPASGRTQLDPPALAEAVKRTRETETNGQPAPKRVSPTADPASASSTQKESAALPTPAAETKRPGAPSNPVSEVNTRLQQRLQCDVSKWLEEAYSARKQPAPFVCTLVHKRTGRVLATSSEHSNKKEAKKDACERLLSNPAFEELLDEEAQPPQQQQQRQQQQQPPLPAQPPTASPPAMVAGVEVTARSKHAATADVRGLCALVSNLARARPSEAPTSPDEITTALVPLQEEPNFARRLSSLAQASALPAFALRGLVLKAGELSLRPRPRPPETKRTGGRLVQEALLEYIKQPMDPKEAGCCTPLAGDIVRIWGLTSEKASEHNGTTGEVVKWMEEKERFAVSTPAVKGRDFLLVRPYNLELLQLSS